MKLLRAAGLAAVVCTAISSHSYADNLIAPGFFKPVFSPVAETRLAVRSELEGVRVGDIWSKDGQYFADVKDLHGFPRGTYAVDLSNGTVEKVKSANGEWLRSAHAASDDADFLTGGLSRSDAKTALESYFDERGETSSKFRRMRFGRTWMKDGKMFAKMKTLHGYPAGTYAIDLQTEEVSKVR